MRATKAYIASLGTTGVLLAASVLMLALVSAVVAFDEWPDGNAATPVKTLVLAPRPSTIHVSTRPHAAAATRAPVRATRGRTAAGRRAAGRTPGSRPRRVTSTRPGAGTPNTPAAQTPAPSSGVSVPVPVPVPVSVPDPQQTLAPVQQATDPIVNTVSNPGPAVSQVADQVQGTTNAVGTAVGNVSPQVGQIVQDAGQVVSQTLHGVPLPGHTLPGH